ncbi:MAG: MotA/TolQ/ExbB proton channel family protein, partial [Kiritimatiellaeota bacterium]|nr:MotA/TolQ/ExbB proton channel family protein [Kiritimatiellota bacterium]
KMFAEDKAGRELRLESRKAAMLALVATLAPLLGLFGTVVGLLEAFMKVAAVGEMGDPSLLADEIAKALVTTVAGLAIAMPALFCHNIFKNRLNLYAVILEEEVSDLVNNLFVKIGR